eukprot:6143378-Heterocapsa_arctica.AAC.1
MDANAKVGSQRDDDDRMEPVGPFYPQVEQIAGHHLHKCSTETGLALVNTWFQPAAGPTWAGPNNTKNR